MKHASTGNMPQVDETDWERVKSMTDAEIQHDEDSPSTTEEDWAGASLRQAGVEIGRVRRRGPQKAPTKVQVAIRFDPDVLDGLKATGKGWQTRVNTIMREWLKAQG